MNTTTVKTERREVGGRELRLYSCSACGHGVGVSANYCPGCGREIVWKGDRE